MNRRNIYSAVGLLLFSLAAMLAAILFTNFKYPMQSQGTLAFGASYRDGINLDKIVLRTRQGDITLHLQDNLWRVAEADGYFANTYLLNLLLTDLNTSVFFSQRENTPQALHDYGLLPPAKDEPASGTEIKTYAGTKLLNDVTIGKQTANHLFRFALFDNEEIWQISGHFDLPEEIYSWLLQPVMELPPSLIETIRFYQDGQIFSLGRKRADMPFSSEDGKKAKARLLTSTLSNLTVEDAADTAGFDKSRYILNRRLEIVTFQGLVFFIDIYVDKNNETWIHITLSTTALPMSIVNDYIRDNKFLYDSWYFKISPETAKILTPLSLT